MSDCPYLLPIWFMYVYFLVWQCQKCTQSNWRDGRRRPYRHCKEIVSSFRSIGKVNVKQLHSGKYTMIIKITVLFCNKWCCWACPSPNSCVLYTVGWITLTQAFSLVVIYDLSEDSYIDHITINKFFSFSSCTTNRFLVAVGVYSHCNKSQMMS